MSLSDKEVLQLAKALDKVLEAREDKWLEINSVMQYKILDAFSSQLADCLRAQTKLIVKLITGNDLDNPKIDEESERISRMMMDAIKKR